MRNLLFALLVLAFAPATASAVTLDDIVALSRAGVAEPVLLALIDRDQSVFAIEPAQLVALKGAGVSETVILAMLKSGRQPPPEAPAAPVQMVEPHTIIVGHGPDKPNTSRREPDALLSANAVVLPYLLLVPAPRSACVARSLPIMDPALFVPPAIGRRMTIDSGPLVVDCQPVSQGRHRSRR